MIPLTHHPDAKLATGALDASARSAQWLQLALFWRRCGARNTARTCVRYAREERTLAGRLLRAAEAES